VIKWYQVYFDDFGVCVRVQSTFQDAEKCARERFDGVDLGKVGQIVPVVTTYRRGMYEQTLRTYRTI
jgi:hypothetical protein